MELDDLVGLATKTIRRFNRQIIYPDINFTCNGSITSWSVLARQFSNVNLTLYPDLQLWRYEGGGIYNKVGSMTLYGGKVERDNIYEFKMLHPLKFEAGDVLGLFQPVAARSRLRVHFQLGIGPGSFFRRADEAVEPPFSSLNVYDNENQESNDYPLISVNTGKVCIRHSYAQ